ncbi:MAG: IS1182 family transposase [Planctomycetota bacterium]|nr:IS1182 family transposase [Planctomycetota bacterium]
MMGMQQAPQSSLFYIGINIGKRVREDHFLRRVKQLIDFDFSYEEVKDLYGDNGNVSVPPPVILKLMLLLVLYNVRSERELMDTVPERIDWLWFLGYDLDSEIPNHSVLSKARKKWGVEVFQSFFERIVLQCMEAGLIDGRKIFVDSSLVDANASNNSVLDTKNLRHQLHRNYKKLEARLEENKESVYSSRRYEKKNSRYISSTDPDAAIVNRGKPKLSYQVHRAVDEQSEIITAAEATPGDVNEAHMMLSLIEKHQTTTGIKAETVVADSKYGTIDNFLACHDRGIQAHIPDLREAAVKRTAQREIFLEDRFLYDSDSDTYRCPAGNLLKAKSLHMNRQSRDYAAPKKVCSACQLREQCTKNKSGRTIKRHLQQDELDRMREASRSSKSKVDIKIRQHLMERSFARGTRYGFDRARWRGLWLMRIQEYLTCAIQNIHVLIKHLATPKKRIVAKALTVKTVFIEALSPFIVEMSGAFCGQRCH